MHFWGINRIWEQRNGCGVVSLTSTLQKNVWTCAHFHIILDNVWWFKELIQGSGQVRDSSQSALKEFLSSVEDCLEWQCWWKCELGPSATHFVMESFHASYQKFIMTVANKLFFLGLAFSYTQMCLTDVLYCRIKLKLLSKLLVYEKTILLIHIFSQHKGTIIMLTSLYIEG